MATVKVVTKPQVVAPGKERHVEHTRQLVQQGLNRGMRLQDSSSPKIVPLPPDESQASQIAQEPQEPAQEPVKESKAKGSKKMAAAGDSVPLMGETYKHGDTSVVVVNVVGSLILLAEVASLKKGSTVFAIEFDAFRKKFEKV